MTNSSKFVALIDAYIELGQNTGHDDAQIIDALTDIFDREELEELGYGDFIRSYFDEDEPVCEYKCKKCIHNIARRYGADGLVCEYDCIGVRETDGEGTVLDCEDYEDDDDEDDD